MAMQATQPELDAHEEDIALIRHHLLEALRVLGEALGE
jgi:hypothetical protein